MSFTTWAICAGALILLLLYSTRQPKPLEPVKPNAEAAAKDDPTGTGGGAL